MDRLGGCPNEDGNDGQSGSPHKRWSEEPTSGNTPTEGDPDNKRHKVLTVIVLHLSLQMVLLKIDEANQTAFVTLTCLLSVLHTVLERRIIRLGSRDLWRVQRISPFVDSTLLMSHNEKEFRRRCRVKRSTFFYICSLLAPTLQKSRRSGIPLENKIALSLNRLGTGNYLLGCADLFGMSESLACIVVREFCAAVLKVIRPLVVPKISAEKFPDLAAQFEAKHGIPFIFGAIDGSHIPIIAPPGDPAPFYNRKGFYSALLQGIVDTECRFWDWDFGWAGSLHDYTVFVNSLEGRRLMAGRYHPYKLIGDAAYPFRTCMYVPFKGTKEQLDPARAHWNFIQSSTRMCVERAFGVLKGRWRILLRRLEMPLENITDVVGACICLHNLCIVHKDFVEDNLLEEAKRWLQEQHIQDFGDLKREGTMRILDYGKAEISRVDIDVDHLINQANSPVSLEDQAAIRAEDTNDQQALKAGVTMHRALAETLFSRHLRETVPLDYGLYDEEFDSSSEDAD